MAGDKPKLVIVGAGIAGTKVLKLVAGTGKFDVTLVEPREYFEIPFAGVRAVVDPSVADKSLVPIASIPGVFKHVRQAAKTVTRLSVVLDNGEQLPFDYAVVATGSTHAGAGTYAPGAAALTLAARKQELKEVSERIQAAKHVVVVGGGPVGLELIGEVLDRYAGKRIALVHAGAQLLEGKSAKVQRHANELLAKHKVEVLLGDRADRVEGGTLFTKAGRSLPADYVIWAAGGQANSAVFAGGDLASTINEKGLVRVDEFLRIEGHPHIFVAGDINSTPGPKLGGQAGFQADSVGVNLLKALAGKAPVKFAPPMAPSDAMFVTFGAKDGMGHVKGCSCTGSFPISFIKGKDLFVGMARGALGVK